MITTIGIVVAVVILLSVEVFALWRVDDDEQPITHHVRTAVKSKPVVAFVFGFICGHLFWP